MSIRPIEYTEALADRILVRLQAGESLLEICKDPCMPSTWTVLQWFDQEDFGKRCMQAATFGASGWSPFSGQDDDFRSQALGF